MQPLQFPPYQFRLKNRENKPYIFDRIRKKFVRLTPEEWVRQHTIHFLIDTLKYPLSLINVEREIKIHNTRKRYDLVIYNPDGTLFLVVECKSYKTTISQATFDQIARYNLILQSQYLMVTNGLNHYYCVMNYEHKSYSFMEKLPDWHK